MICISGFSYTGIIRNAIKKFKFEYKKNYYKIFSEFLANSIKIYFKNQKLNLISYVPITKEKSAERGYNQSELIAREVSKILKINFESTLEKINNNYSQQKLNFNQRQLNINGAYAIKKNINIKNKIILLIDDVVTTGATLHECSKILSQENTNIFCACVAYTPKKI
jgi:ComF family protein